MRPSKLLATLAGLVTLLAVACGASEAAAANFAITIEAPKQAKVSEASRAVVRVVPKGGWKVNLKYPIRLKLQPAAGVEFAKAELAAADAKVTEQEARFEVGFTVKEQGARTVNGELKFSVCVADKCDIKKEAVTWTTSAR